MNLKDIKANKICIIKSSSFGDIVQTLYILPELRRHFPNAHISWIVKPEFFELVSMHPVIDEVIIFRPNNGRHRYLKFLWDLWRKKFDLVIDFQGLAPTGHMTFCSRAKYRIGLETAREGSSRSYNYIVKNTDKFIPPPIRYWQVLKEFGSNEFKATRNVYIPEEARNWVLAEISKFQNKYIVIHPGAKWITRRWPADKFAEVALRIVSEYNFYLVIVGEKGEEHLAESIMKILKNAGIPLERVSNYLGRTTIKQLAFILENAEYLIGNDSGPMHLAAMFDTPVVSVFTCSDVVRSGPVNSGNAFVYTELECRGSYNKICPFKGEAELACMKDVSVDRVFVNLKNYMKIKLIVVDYCFN